MRASAPARERRPPARRLSICGRGFREAADRCGTCIDCDRPRGPALGLALRTWTISAPSTPLTRASWRSRACTASLSGTRSALRTSRRTALAPMRSRTCSRISGNAGREAVAEQQHPAEDLGAPELARAEQVPRRRPHRLVDVAAVAGHDGDGEERPLGVRDADERELQAAGGSSRRARTFSWSRHAMSVRAQTASRRRRSLCVSPGKRSSVQRASAALNSGTRAAGRPIDCAPSSSGSRYCSSRSSWA